MTRKMLINARTPEQLRVAVVDGDKLENYQFEAKEQGLTRGNIYRGTIAGVQPSLNAAFIDYGAERNGFLPMQDVVREAYYKKPSGKGRPRIEEVLENGRSIVVQVMREPEGSKGATLTTNLSLAGRYLVLTPFDDTCGVSRKVDDDEARKKLKERAKGLTRPKGCGIIVRTNAIDQTKTTLNRDLSALARLWKRVGSEARRGKGNKLIYSDQDLILRALRDYLDNSIQEVLTDDDAAFEKAQEYMQAFMPRSKTRLIRYAERTPIFSRYDLERQIERIYDRTVQLPSGGSIVIDSTEALIAIDVNSGRSTKAASQEETAIQTNLEAASEVARQLRLRDIGGLVVVDFIDMWGRRNQRKVEQALREALKSDKARSTVGRISDNGLLEINRQRIQQAVLLRTSRACPTCSGTGRIASPELVGLNLMRRIEARAASGFAGKVKIALHPELADAFQNSRRRDIADLEQEFGLKIEVTASNRLHRSDLEIDWLDGQGSAGRAGVPNGAREAPAKPDTSPSSRRRRRRSSKAAAPASGNGKVEADAADGEKAAESGEPETTGSKSGSRPRRRRRRRRSSASRTKTEAS